LFGRERRDRELAAELESHLQFQIEENVARGMAPEEARRQALIASGGIEQTKERYRDGRGLPSLDSLLQDARFSLRVLRKHAKLSGIAVASIAIGMGAASVGLSVINALLLKPPSVPAADQLLSVYSVSVTHGYTTGVSYPDYRYFRENNRSFSELAGSWPIAENVSVSYEGRIKDTLIEPVSDNYFAALDVHPVLGPGFSEGDNAAPTAVVSYAYWKWLGSDPGIIGKTLVVSHSENGLGNTTTINDVSVTIVGVAPEGFSGTGFLVTDFWYPLSARDSIFRETVDWKNPQTRVLEIDGRLRPGVTREQALADVRRMARELASAYPASDRNLTAGVAPMTMLPPGEEDKALRIFSIAVAAVIGLVLFAACANVTNLLLALAGARRQEILVRATLGATRARLVRQLLLDSTIIAGTGGLLGFALATYGLSRLAGVRPVIPILGSLPLVLDFRPDVSVLAAVVALVLIVGVAMGLVPGLHASTPHLATALNGEAATSTRKSRARNLLVMAQVAVCTLISVGAGLCVKSLSNLQHANTGYSARNVVIFASDDMQTRGYTEQQGRAVYERVREAVAQLPGAASISLAGAAPLGLWDGYVVPWDVTDHQVAGRAIGYEIVDENYFATVGVPLLAGRAFGDADSANSPKVVVINRTMAERYWPNENSLGRSFRIEDGKQTVTVVGVVGDSAHEALDEKPWPYMYFPLSQRYWPVLHLLVRTDGNPEPLMKPLAERLRKADPNLAFAEHTLAELIRLHEFVPRLALTCVGAFGALAWLLAAAGLYGSVFYSVSERTREMGIRVTLGAEPWDLWQMVLRETGVVACGGICVGIGGGIAATIVVRSLLHGIQPVEWSVLLAVAVAIGAMALGSAYMAARPWMRVDPIEAVRHA
jgi:predicted permease